MSQEAKIQAARRDKVGSRAARKLRAAGRLPVCLQGDGKENLDLHIDRSEFLNTRRAHVHLYDLEIEGGSEAAVVRELQYDVLGEEIVHVEFKRVTRGVETEAEIELAVVGMPRSGAVNLLVQHITVRTIPSLIPDSIEVPVGHLEMGAHLRARDLELPEGVYLAVPEDLEVVAISSVGATARIEPEGEEGAESEAGSAAPGPDEG